MRKTVIAGKPVVSMLRCKRGKRLVKDLNQDEGIRHFNEGDFFEAHEAWEKEWKKAPESARKHFFQGMIMIAAALHHHVRKETAGAERLLAKGLEVLGAHKDAPIEIDREAFLREVALFYERLKDGRELLSNRDFPKIKQLSTGQNAP